MFIKRKCKCVFSANQPIMRFEDIVTKAGATPPDFSGCSNDEWAKLDCPYCHGTGAIIEEIINMTPAQEEALLRDFRKRMAVKA